MSNRIFFMCGNARTFLECFQSMYDNLINKLFDGNSKDNTYVLLYLKCDDPGPKGQKGWNFRYPFIDPIKIKNEIINFRKKFDNITIITRILPTNEITNMGLLSQVKKRKLYNGRHFQRNSFFLRALHCHYNIERCGKIIDSIEIQKNKIFDYFIYVRPDLFFTKPCPNISIYNPNRVILAKGPNHVNNDHLAIIPRKYKNQFFKDRMELIRTNEKHDFQIAEQIYKYTIRNNFVVRRIGEYYIKRPDDTNE